MRHPVRRLVLSIMVASALGTALMAADLVTKNWRVYNVRPATQSYWDINKAEIATTPPPPSGGVQFPIQLFDSESTGSFAVYLLLNYNVDLTDKTLTAYMNWMPYQEAVGGNPERKYVTRTTTCDDGNTTYGGSAYVRFEFQDVTAGSYDSNDYWWSTDSLDLNVPVPYASGPLRVSLADRTHWTNQAGRSATDTTQDWVDWTGTIVHTSPYDGFTQAMKNVKQVGLSFGSACRYASGIAFTDDSPAGFFNLNHFEITP